MKALSKIEKLIEDQDFEKAGRLEKFSMILLDIRLEERLSEQEFLHWVRIQKVFSLCFKQFDQTKAIRVIRNQITGCERHEVASKLYRDMCEVYGPFQRRNKEMARSIAAQRMWTLAVRLEKSGEFLESAQVMKMAAELEGLYKEDALDFDPDEIKLPEITISNDPKFIHAQDTEYEEVPEEDEEQDDILS